MEVQDLQGLLLDISHADIIRQKYLTEFLAYVPDLSDKINTLNNRLGILDKPSVPVAKQPVILFGVGNAGDGTVMDATEEYVCDLRESLPITCKQISSDIRYTQIKDPIYGLKSHRLVDAKNYDVGYLKRADIGEFTNRDKFVSGPKVLQCKLIITKEEIQQMSDFVNTNIVGPKVIDEIAVYIGKTYSYRQPNATMFEVLDYVEVVSVKKFIIEPIQIEFGPFTQDLEFIVNIAFGL